MTCKLKLELESSQQSDDCKHRQDEVVIVVNPSSIAVTLGDADHNARTHTNPRAETGQPVQRTGKVAAFISGLGAFLGILVRFWFWLWPRR